MPNSARRASSVLLLVVGLLASFVLAVAPATTAQAADDKGLVNGAIKFPQGDKPGIKMLWFDKSWNYLGTKNAPGGSYSIWLDPGTYHLQFVDQRAAYDVKKYAPTDIQVTVRANDLSSRNVTMKKGAVITGTAQAGGKPLKNARVVAASRTQQSFSTVANKEGQFALGGLPQGQYSVFTYDNRKTWVGKSAWAGSVKPGKSKNLAIKLTKKAGTMTVYLFTPNGRLGTKTSVTVRSKANGQWWTATANHGTAVFKGLYPGGYTLKFDGAGVWFAKTGAVEKANVKPSMPTFGTFHLTKRGGWITGSLVDRGAEDIVLEPAYSGAKGAQVALFNANGTKLTTTTSDADGNFKLSGRLATASGLTIAIDPGVESAGYMRGEGYCQFDHVEFDGFALTTGKGTEVGDLSVPRTTGQDDPACATPDENVRHASRR